ncbi:hypothetical protein BDF14DRAFT_1882082 [Spinellus fusiger]|nr:hypothetical protein BDF14DRAFT_1882082 [Spinellus fusiger]
MEKDQPAKPETVEHKSSLSENDCGQSTLKDTSQEQNSMVMEEDSQSFKTSLPAVTSTSAVTSSHPLTVAASTAGQNLSELNLTSEQLHQINAAHAQAIAHAAAAAIASGGNYQQFFSQLESSTADQTQALDTAHHQAGVMSDDLHHSGSVTQLTTDMLKRELMNQKVRADNRERKKRWRVHNEERNKDNDLRCRVNKRAIKLFGKDDSDHKLRWVEDEFQKRRAKRQEKQRLKHAVDGAMNASPVMGGAHVGNGHSEAMDFATINSVAAAAAQQVQSSATAMHTLQDADYMAMLSSFNSNIAAAIKAHENTQFSDQLIELLRQQQQPHGTSGLPQAQEYASPKLDKITSNDQQTPDHQAIDVDEKLASRLLENETLPHSEAKNSVAEEGKDASAPKRQQPSGDYPMDAVLTLMQLNAGWRQ